MPSPWRNLAASIRSAAPRDGRKHRRLAPQIEALQSRLTPAVYLSGGHLIIYGTPDNDTVSVLRDARDPTYYKVTETRQGAGSTTTQVTRFLVVSVTGDIAFTGYDGDDYFTNATPERSFGRGGNGNDVLIGGTAYDEFYGDAGNDSLNGGAGSDDLYGGAGADSIYAGDDSSSATNWVDGGSGNDLLVGSLGADDIYGGDGNDTLEGGAGDLSVNHLHGGNGNDRLKGAGGRDFLHGDAGNDFLQGYGGDDYLHGDSGVDSLYGGDGDDYLDGGRGDDAADRLVGGAGADRFRDDPYQDDPWWPWSYTPWYDHDAPDDFDESEGDSFLPW